MLPSDELKEVQSCGSGGDGTPDRKCECGCDMVVAASLLCCSIGWMFPKYFGRASRADLITARGD